MSEPSSATYSWSSDAPRAAPRALDLGPARGRRAAARACARCRGSSPTTRPASRRPRSRRPPRRARSRGRPRATTTRSRSGSASRNGPGRVRVGRLGEAELERGSPGGRDPRVELRARPDGEHDASAGPQSRARSPRRRRSMSGTSMSPKRQRTPSTESSAKRQRGGVLDREADAVEAELLGAAASRLDHLRRDVGRDQLAAGLEPRQRREADLAGSGRQLEHALPGLRVEQLDHPLGQRRRRAREEIAPALPAGRRRSARPRPARPPSSSMRPRP